MKTIAYLKPGIACIDAPQPALTRETDVKIKISYCAICGTDAHIYAGHLDDVLVGNNVPYPLGHEASGTVVELGEGATVKNLAVGDMVTYYFKAYCGSCIACRDGQEHFCEHPVSVMSAMSEYIVVDQQQVYRLPAGVDLKSGCLAEPVSVCLHGIDLAGIQQGDRVAISGGGGTGLIALQLARMSGASCLTMIEPVEEKRRLAARLGATHVVDPACEPVAEAAARITDGRGFNAVIETSGSQRACQPAFDITAHGGTLVFFALYGADYHFPLNLWDVFKKEITIRGVYQSPYVWPRTMQLLGNLDLACMPGAVFSPETCREAFDAQLTGEYPKVLIAF